MRPVRLMFVAGDDTVRQHLDYPRPRWRWMLSNAWIPVLFGLLAVFLTFVEEAGQDIWWLRWIFVLIWSWIGFYFLGRIPFWWRAYDQREDFRRWWESLEGRHRDQLVDLGMSVGLIDQVIEHLKAGDMPGAVGLTRSWLEQQGE